MPTIRALFGWLLASLVLASFATAPASAGGDNYNHDVGVHVNAVVGPEYWASIHCEPLSNPSPCGTTTVYVRSVGITRQQFLTLKAAAAGSPCTTSAVIGSPFDVEASAAWPALWADPHMTAARKATICTLVDEWM